MADKMCYYPFVQMTITADGKFRPCCKASSPLTHEGRILDASTDTILTAWNSDSLKQMREQFRNGEKPETCRNCWKEEAAGLDSLRAHSLVWREMFERRQTANPRSVELSSSNLCNLKCRICGGHSSTKWIAESKEILNEEHFAYQNLNDINLSALSKIQSDLLAVSFYGGEPLLDPQNLRLIEQFIRDDQAPGISLAMNTNGTVCNDDLINKMREFRQIHLNFSIDDTYDRFEYQRKGASFEKVVSNVLAYKSALFGRNNNTLNIFITVSLMNVFSLGETIQHHLRTFPGMPIIIAVLNEPNYLSIDILPKGLKAIVSEKLNGIPRSDLIQGIKIDGVVSYMMNSDPAGKGERLRDFFQILRSIDNSRNERFSAVQPEFWELLKASRYE
ncbi:MAG: twitch domain-containing radical SAM protein [Pseudobdellovibrionaceae bacterium]